MSWQMAIRRWRAGRDWQATRAQLASLRSSIPRSESDSTHVLFWRGVPGRGSMHSEAIIASALRLRGIGARFVICDAALSGCIQRSLEDKEPISKWTKRCPQCVDYGVRILDALGIPYIGMSSLVSEKRRAEVREICVNLPDSALVCYEFRGVHVGQFAVASTLRYLKGQPLEGHELLLREYLYSALLCSEAARNALNHLKPSRAYMQRHIEYVGWAPAYVVLTKAGLPVTTWGGSPTQDGRIVLRNTSGTDWNPLYSMSNESWENRSTQPLSREEDEALDLVLSHSWRDQGSLVNLAGNLGTSGSAQISREEVLRELNISDDKPIWCVFAHMTWDAGFNPDVMIFKDVISWTLETVSAILQIRDVTWLLKVHPGESRGTVSGVENIIKSKFPNIRQRIRIIPADSRITTNDLCSLLAGGITMHGTIGVQLPARGIPVIVGERTHYAGKGFTYDGFTREKYFELLHGASSIALLSEHQKELGRRYAYSLHFQRTVPINMAEGRRGYAPLNPQRLHLLFPGNDEVMDMICDRIINGGEFILDDSVAMTQG